MQECTKDTMQNPQTNAAITAAKSLQDTILGMLALAAIENRWEDLKALTDKADLVLIQIREAAPELDISAIAGELYLARLYYMEAMNLDTALVNEAESVIDCLGNSGVGVSSDGGSVVPMYPALVNFWGDGKCIQVPISAVAYARACILFCNAYYRLGKAEGCCSSYNRYMDLRNIYSRYEAYVAQYAGLFSGMVFTSEQGRELWRKPLRLTYEKKRENFVIPTLAVIQESMQIPEAMIAEVEEALAGIPQVIRDAHEAVPVGMMM